MQSPVPFKPASPLPVCMPAFHPQLARLCPGVLVEGAPDRVHLPDDAQAFVQATVKAALAPSAPLALKLGGLQLLPYLV